MLLGLAQSAGDSDKLWADSAVEVGGSEVLAGFGLGPRAEEADMMLGYCFPATCMFGVDEMDKSTEDIDDVCCFG